ncbi:hypothetical protein L1049_025653 [Liquidambar formosana]|uniref:CHCH domain-containing protein n=1 Tax=Liquidambar formosana TaxID=63359 RepID=A0AAP0NFG4_LIQFO
MPRRSSGGRPAPRAAARAPVRNPPQPAAPAPPPAPVQNVNRPVMGGLGSTIAEAPAAASAPTMSSLGGSDACGGQSKAFQDCLNNYGSDISKCQFYLDMLSECRRNSGAVLGA